MNWGRGGMLGLLLLRVVSEYSGLRRKPPVTAALIAANTLIYLRPEFVQPFVPRIDRILFNPHLILKHKDLKRFLLPAFYHLGEPHLVYNMLSLLWKGLQLESALGSFEFAKMVSTLVIMSQGMNLLLAKILLSFGYYKAYYHEFSAGFSGVLFAMKVVLYSQSDDYTYVQGISLPTRYAAWAELILIQLLEPRVSFLGHLGGILAGLLYMQMNATFTGSSPGPLTWIAKGLISFLGWPLRVASRVFTSSRGRGFGRGRIGGRLEEVWSCGACTYDNSVGSNVCEMCGTIRGRGPTSHGVSTSSEVVADEELRRLRIRRFDR